MPALAERTVSDTMATLKACEHQVGGHMTKDAKPDTLVDGQGSFYKPFQAGDRNAREAAFYGLMWGIKTLDTPGSSVAPSEPLLPVETWGQGEHFLGQVGTATPQDIEGLKAFIPKSYGVTVVEGRQYLVMEDVCAVYKKPCVLDLKMGFQTWYPWGGEAYRLKCEPKDKTTTQSSVGFRLSGLQVYRRSTGETEKMERQWGKTLNADTMPSALVKFAGDLDPKALWSASPAGIMPQLQAIQQWFTAQRSFCFFQASLLFTYEGEATSIEEANVQVHLIDFAHTFPSNGEQDTNVLRGVDSLISMCNTKL